MQELDANVHEDAAQDIPRAVDEASEDDAGPPFFAERSLLAASWCSIGYVVASAATKRVEVAQQDHSRH